MNITTFYCIDTDVKDVHTYYALQQQFLALGLQNEVISCFFFFVDDNMMNIS
jgi:hypothetical protein